MKNKILKFSFLGVLLFSYSMSYAQQPNILLIIADDYGVDFCNGYHNSALMPTTPTLDSLRANGITFENVFATPKCTPSRSTIMSGKHGIKTGVVGTPGDLDTSEVSIFDAIEAETNGAYNDAVIGKWHISHPIDSLHPNQHGADYYSGHMSNAGDYYSWEHTTNGITVLDTNYVTQVLTDESINWINSQPSNEPWFLWLAHVTPHGPFHLPPTGTYSLNNTGTNKRKYITMVENMDYEIGRMLDSLPQSVKDNTIIIFIGDNGSPTTILQDYPAGRGKSTLYQGGIRVPMIISGAGVTRQGERESALVHITDIYATLLEVVGADLPGGIYNSLSFDHLLDGSAGDTRDYNYSEVLQDTVDQYTIRNEQYKLIESNVTGDQEFYDLLNDSFELNDLLITGLDPTQAAIKLDLEQEAAQIRSAWSCRDYIQNGDEEGIDCGGTYCTPCVVSVEEIEQDDYLNIYPNPTRDEFVIDFNTGNYILELADINGIRHHQANVIGEQYILDVNNLPSGVYILKLFNQSTNKTTTKKVLKY